MTIQPWRCHISKGSNGIRTEQADCHGFLLILRWLDKSKVNCVFTNKIPRKCAFIYLFPFPLYYVFSGANRGI
jgi:hypothetical protein